jgi:3-hydroxyacyl-[acyl-carrier-protein] dehydratase
MSVINNDLFSIKKITHDEGSIKAILGINADSEILKGHFPGHPVVPGACMLQITKEVLQSVLQTALRLKKADQLKFITMIDPANTRRIELDITYKYQDDGGVIASAKLSNPETIYFKLQADFVGL